MDKKYRVTLTIEERAALEQRVRSGKGAARMLNHVHMLLKADEGDGGPALTNAEVALVLMPTVCRYARKLDGVAEVRLIKLACSAPPEGRIRWTLALLADRMVALGHVESMSYETVRRALKKTS